MAESRVGVIIEAEDRATSVIAGVRGSLDQLSGKLKSLEPDFKRMATVGTVAFGALSLVVKKSLDSAAEAAKVQAQLGAVLKSTAGAAGVTREAALDLSQALQKTTTFSDETVLSAENMLLTFTKIGKNIFPQATETVLDMATALGTNATDAAIQLGKALNDPILGVTALRRVGVSFSEAQQEQIKKLVETGQLLTAQKLILKELSTEFGGSATAQAKTFAGAMAQLNNQVDDLMEAVGNALIPVIQKVTDYLKPVVQKIMDWAQANPTLVARILEVGLAVAGLTALLGFLGLALIPITAAITFLTTPIGLAVLALVALAGIVVALWGHWNDLMQALDEKTGLITFMKAQWDNVVTVFKNNLLPALQKLWASLQPYKPFLEALGQVIGFTLVAAITLLTYALEGIAILASTLIEKWATFVSWVNSILLPVFSAIGDAIATVVDWATKLGTALSKLNIFQGAKDLIGGIGSSIGKAIGINDGIVQNGQVITTHPDDYIFATKDPSSLGGGNVNFSFDFRNSTIADKDAFIRDVSKALGRAMALKTA